jgi:hypothetical protein
MQLSFLAASYSSPTLCTGWSNDGSQETFGKPPTDIERDLDLFPEDIHGRCFCQNGEWYRCVAVTLLPSPEAHIDNAFPLDLVAY